MQVTKDNFQTELPKIKRAIDECDFLAFDTELTGLSSGKHAKINALDTIEQRYVS